MCKEIVNSVQFSLTSAEDYFHFDLADRSCREIENFIGSREKSYWVCKINGTPKQNPFFNKYDTYRILSKYYGREIIKVTSEDDFPEFCRFILSHEKIIVKPSSSSLGKGVSLISADSETIARDIFNCYMQYTDGFIAEEVIKQNSEIAEFHPQSVNTVRMMTISHNDYVKIWHPFLRIGRGESVVDNASAGGIECSISPDTGILEEACDFSGKTYEVHPDTGKKLRGFKIPRWDEAVALAKELAEIFPDHHYIGWDFALTENGWIVIEGNSAAGMGFQGIKKTGVKKEFRNEIREIRRNK